MSTVEIGDSRLCLSGSRRRAGIAPTLAGRITLWHGIAAGECQLRYGEVTVCLQYKPVDAD